MKTRLSAILMAGIAVGYLLYSPTLHAEDTAKFLHDLSQHEIDASFLIGQALESINSRHQRCSY